MQQTDAELGCGERLIMSAAFYWVLFVARVTMRMPSASVRPQSSFIVTSYDDFTFFLSFVRKEKRGTHDGYSIKQEDVGYRVAGTDATRSRRYNFL